MALPVEQIIPKLNEIGLVKDGQPVSLSQFKKFIDVHLYGRSAKSGRYVVYIGPKENRFGFYPPKTTKKETIEIAYEYYCELFTELKYPWMDGIVCWGNLGIPLTYSKLRSTI